MAAKRNLLVLLCNSCLVGRFASTGKLAVAVLPAIQAPQVMLTCVVTHMGRHIIEKKNKTGKNKTNYAVMRHGGSLCTQKRPKTCHTYSRKEQNISLEIEGLLMPLLRKTCNAVGNGTSCADWLGCLSQQFTTVVNSPDRASQFRQMQSSFAASQLYCVTQKGGLLFNMKMAPACC